MALKSVPPVHSRDWNAMVDYRIQCGFGVEDIALQLGANVQSVAFRVRELREAGKLAKWFLGAKN